MRCILWLALVTACGAAPEADAVAAVLDDFHDAAWRGDEERFFGHFATDAVFLGTAASERWTVDELREHLHSRFVDHRVWHNKARVRSVSFSPGGDVAWFDEILDGWEGERRGTGVLRRVDGAWKIVSYALSITVPRDAASDVLARIREGPDREILYEGRSIVLGAWAPHSVVPVYEDDDYRFAIRRHRSMGVPRAGLFVFRKKSGTWMQVRKLATAGATLGRSPGFGQDNVHLAVSWDHSRFRKQEFVPIPAPGENYLNLPDNIVRDGNTYKLQFHSSMASRPGLGYMLTEFMVDKDELDRAFPE